MPVCPSPQGLVSTKVRSSSSSNLKLDKGELLNKYFSFYPPVMSHNGGVLRTVTLLHRSFLVTEAGEAQFAQVQVIQSMDKQSKYKQFFCPTDGVTIVPQDWDHQVVVVDQVSPGIDWHSPNPKQPKTE